jgi:hypothetical protein
MKNQNQLTKSQVKFLDKFTKGTWSFDQKTGLVNIEGSFECSGLDLPIYRKLKNLKNIRFGSVSQDFCVPDHLLPSLDGCPQYVGGLFHWSGNRATNLIGGPKYVGGDYECILSNLTSLEGIATHIGGWLGFYANDISSLEHLSLEIACKSTVGLQVKQQIRFQDDIPATLDDFLNFIKTSILPDEVIDYLKESIYDQVASLPIFTQEWINENAEIVVVKLSKYKHILEARGLKFPEQYLEQVETFSDLATLGF